MGRIYKNTNTLQKVMVLLIITLWSNHVLLAQVKIGDNPSVIAPGSLLELESNELVLVITRVTTQQMNSLRPLAGALVYNTDLGCVHSFNGATWTDLCGQGGAGGISTMPGNSIIDNGGAFYNDENVQLQITDNTTMLNDHIVIDEDTDVQNELSNLTLNGNVIRLSNPLNPTNEIDLTTLLGSGGNPNDELIADGTVVGNNLIINEGGSNQVTIDVTSLVGGGSGSNNTTFEVASGNLSITDGAGTLSVPLTSINTGTDTNLGNSNLTQSGGNRTYNLNNQNLAFSGNGNVGIGSVTPQEKLHVGANLRVDGSFLDSTGDSGNSGEVLSSNGTGTNWIPVSVATSPYHAVGKMTESSFTNAINVFFVNDLGIGNYRVLFGTAASSINYVIQLSLANMRGGSIEVIAQTTTSFTVQLYDSLGNPADGNWFFTVIDF